jgi:hypothetical protein
MLLIGAERGMLLLLVDMTMLRPALKRRAIRLKVVLVLADDCTISRNTFNVSATAETIKVPKPIPCPFDAH